MVLWFIYSSCAGQLLLLPLALLHPSGGGCSLFWVGWSPPCPYQHHSLKFLEMLWGLQMVVYGSFGLWKGSVLENPYPVPEVLHTGKCSGILMSFSDIGEALRDVPGPGSGPAPRLGSHKDTEQDCMGLSFLQMSRSCFETSNSRVYSDALKEALGPFIFPAYVLWLSKGVTKPERIFLGLCRFEPYAFYFALSFSLSFSPLY